MAFTTGTKLGPYEIQSAIGAGGMGEVYRASDTELKREVAPKVLPELFAGDAQRAARFEREAQLLASLNHSHIAHLHGVEEVNGIRALIMELVEGPTLAERIAQRPVPVEEALPLAKQIAEALKYAQPFPRDRFDERRVTSYQSPCTTTGLGGPYRPGRPFGGSL